MIKTSRMIGIIYTQTSYKVFICYGSCKLGKGICMSRLTRIYPIQTFNFKKREQTKINNNSHTYICTYLLRQMSFFF